VPVPPDATPTRQRALGHALIGVAVVLVAIVWVTARPVPPAGGEERAALDGSAASSRVSLARAPRGSGVEPVPRVAAAGDIACDQHHEFFNDGDGTAKWCRAVDTREVLRRLDPDVVLPLGDTQYDEGRLAEYQASYDLSWGRLLERTRPVVGNHEYYASSKARGYFSYFGERAGPAGQGWYSYELGGWHVVALNSNCQMLPCGPGSPQYEWLARDLADSSASCTLAYFHHPRFSSGPHGDDPSVTPLWRLLYGEGAELILVGHDHIYERFEPLTPAGARDDLFGIRQFTVGTGGAQLYPVEEIRQHSVTRNTKSFGVLEVALREAAYSWRFVPVSRGGYTDRGTAACHGARPV
jgi:acid phosphatase type 7